MQLKVILFLLPGLLAFAGCSGQANKTDVRSPEKSARIGGPFENSELMYVGMPDITKPADTSAGWSQPGQHLMITGTIFKPEGKTPAPCVILYYYHTDISGHYSNKAGLDQRAVRHGYIRGWVKTDSDGKYTIYTVRPAPYPGRTEPAHIHPAIKEPGLNEYYIDEFVFDDDPLLTSEKRLKTKNRGGSGVLRTTQKGNLQIAEHNIILGLNIPGYPETNAKTIPSGKSIGEDVISFTPLHVWGPDRGSRACPVCKYGRKYGILYFVGNNPDWIEIKRWLNWLEIESQKRGDNLKVYLVYGNENDSQKKQTLENIGEELNIKLAALTIVPSFSDKASDIYLNKIDQQAGNTFIIYKNSNIIYKHINISPDEKNFKNISRTLDGI